jgi:hypothetical protein
MLTDGDADWVIYLDADAYVNDLEFDVRSYLAERQSYSLIAAPGTGKGKWDINAGVLFINLRHSAGSRLIHRWNNDFHNLVSDDMLKSSPAAWSFSPNDQDLLQLAVREDLELGETLLVEEPSLINHPNASFIRQVLRVHGNMGTRLRIAKLDIVSTLLRQRPAVAEKLGLDRVPAGSMKDATFSNLTELANKYKSDKGTAFGAPPHRYTELYELLFFPMKFEPISLVEMGLAVGGPEVGGPVERSVVSPSIQMWLDYFPSAHIYGFDISDFSHMRHSRFTFVRGDGGEEEDVRRFADTVGAANVVIDDASHASRHQQIAFKYMFDRLVPGGIYIIEDVHWQPSVFEWQGIVVPKTAEFFNSYFNEGIYLENPILSEAYMVKLSATIVSYTCFHAFDGTASPPKLVVIRKGDRPFDEDETSTTIGESVSL